MQENRGVQTNLQTVHHPWLDQCNQSFSDNSCWTALRRRLLLSCTEVPLNWSWCTCRTVHATRSVSSFRHFLFPFPISSFLIPYFITTRRGSFTLVSSERWVPDLEITSKLYFSRPSWSVHSHHLRLAWCCQWLFFFLLVSWLTWLLWCCRFFSVRRWNEWKVRGNHFVWK